MKKIIFSDIDKTLAIGKEVSNENKKWIKKWVDAGNLFVLVSGRVIPYTKMIAKQIGIGNYIICNNGSLIYDIKKEEVIYKNEISKDALTKIFDIVNRYDARCILGGLKTVYTNKIKYPEEETLILDITDEIYNENPITQITISHKDEDIILKIIDEIKVVNEVSIINRHRFLYDKNYKYDGRVWIDVTSHNLSKKDAIIRLLEILNISLNHSVRIGDDLNDLPMFLDEGLNVAVSNAHNSLKEKAHYITTSCKENGVANLIKKILDNEI